MGKISIQEYNYRVECLLKALPADDNNRRLKYELCIARNEIDLLGPANMAAIFDLANQLFEFNNRISTTFLPTKEKIQFYLENVTNLGLLLIKSDSIFRWKIGKDKKDGLNIEPELIAELDAFMLGLTNEVEGVLPWIKPLARNFVHDIMLAQCFESQVCILLMLGMNALQYPIKKFNFHDNHHRSRLILHTSFAKEALEVFWDHQFYRNAYNVTLMLLELNDFAAHSGVILDLNENTICEKADWLQQKLGVGPRQLQVKALIEAYESGSEFS